MIKIKSANSEKGLMTGPHGKALSDTINLSARGKKKRKTYKNYILNRSNTEMGPHDTAWWREVMGLVGRRLMAARPSELPWGCHTAMGPSTAANLRKQRRYKTSQEL